MTDQPMAATRDATAYNRPNVRSPKQAHVAVIDGTFWTAYCSGVMLDENCGVPAATIPPGLRCSRSGCRNRWPSYEEDEPAEKIQAAFDAGPKGVTRRPRSQSRSKPVPECTGANDGTCPKHPGIKSGATAGVIQRPPELEEIDAAFARLKVLEDAYRRHFPDGRLGPPREDS